MAKQHVISIDVKSDVDSKTYVGQFTIKKLALMDFSRQARIKLELSGGAHYTGTPGVGLSPVVEQFNEMVSHLKVAIVKHPDWWDLDEITDYAVLDAVYQEVLKFENSFLPRGGNEDTNSRESSNLSTGNSSSQTEATNAPTPVDSLVEQEIPATYQP